MNFKPHSIPEVQEIVQDAARLVVRGGGSKPALSSPPDGAVCLDMSGLSGIIEYSPDEYTFTAYAGTPVQMAVAELAQHGQYLPFDPMLSERGATLGGTVAANMAGSRRYRYGGVRDFILGVHFVDGKGQLVRSGGKVVKNSAGFDLSKFMVGSLGRYGVLVSISFKVFPEQPSFSTLFVMYPDLVLALAASYRLATSPLEIEALDVIPKAQGYQLAVRLGGLPEALPDRVARVQQRLAEGSAGPPETLEGALDEAYWQFVSEGKWAAPAMQWVKAPLMPNQTLALDQAASGMLRRYTAGANIAWLAADEMEALDSYLCEQGLAGLRLFGPPGQPYLGERKGLSLARRVKQALDPDGVFLEA